MRTRCVAVIGANGGIGRALVDALLADDTVAMVHGCARNRGSLTDARLQWHPLDLLVPDTITAAAAAIARTGPLDTVVIATGMLWSEQWRPEKSLSQVTAEHMEAAFRLNTIGPTLVLQQFLPLLSREHRSVAVVLSARVGSISDNRLGGWHSYRASKAALNMLVKGAAIELQRSNKAAIVVSLHPGTVATRLSEPFQKNVAQEKLFTPAVAAQHLLNVIAGLTPEDSGRCFAWDGKEILP